MGTTGVSHENLTWVQQVKRLVPLYVVWLLSLHAAANLSEGERFLFAAILGIVSLGCATALFVIAVRMGQASRQIEGAAELQIISGSS